MRLDRPFLKLPISFDAEAIAADVRALPASAWAPHPTGFKGNEAVRLITPGGIETDDMDGQMAPTEHLLACRSIMAVMADIGAVWGRSRLMGLGPGGEVPLHVDSHYYWRTHWRIHIPIITNPGVTFACGSETVHMAAGECWLFDSFRWHRVRNASDQQRIHLVLDTVGGGRLRELMDAARNGAAAAKAATGKALGPLAYERINSPKVMSPWELRAHLDFLKGEAVPHPKLGLAIKRLDHFADDWAAAWARYGTDDEGFDDYLALLEAVKSDLDALGGTDILLKNRLELYFTLDHLIFLNAVKMGHLTEEIGKTPAAA